MKNNIKVLIKKEDIYKRIKELADEINSKYDNNSQLDVICILKGAYAFFAELTKHLKMPIKTHFVTLSSYGDEKTSSGKVEVKDMRLPDFKERNVLVVEDIVDKGYTMDCFLNKINAKDVKLAVLLDKKCVRKVDVKVDYRGFEIEDKFVLGFGMDYEGLYRNLEYIGYVQN